MTIPSDREIVELLQWLDQAMANGGIVHRVGLYDAARIIRSLRQQLAAKDSIGDGPAALPVGPREQTPEPARLNFNKDGTLDEIAAENASVHLEQMEFNSYWMRVTAAGVDHIIWFHANGKIAVSHVAEEDEPVAEGRGEAPSVPNPNLESSG